MWCFKDIDEVCVSFAETAAKSDVPVIVGVIIPVLMLILIGVAVFLFYTFRLKKYVRNHNQNK